MKTWWLAIDKNFCSYLELKHRKVVAQGWPQLGSLISFGKFYPNDYDQFVQAIQLLGDVACRGQSWWSGRDRKPERCPAVMWNLLDVKRGDLIIGIEGIKVMGICEMPSDGIASYRHDGEYEYAQTVGFPVNWVDWDSSIFGFTPTTPGQSVHGIKGLIDERQAVIDAWNKYKS